MRRFNLGNMDVDVWGSLLNLNFPPMSDPSFFRETESLNQSFALETELKMEFLFLLMGLILPILLIANFIPLDEIVLVEAVEENVWNVAIRTFSSC